jgi:C4-dicarboxylate-binding protein DctP
MFSWRPLSVRAVATLLLVVGFASGVSAQVTVKVGHDQPEPSTHHQAALKWKELVEKQTDGKMKVQVFPSSQLGSGIQMVEQVQAGALEVAILPTAWVAPLAPSVQVLDLPFLFPNRDVAHKVIDGSAGVAILQPLEKVNIKGVGFWESGFKQFTGNFSITQPADYKGTKIRTMPAPVIQEQFKAFGAVPTMINFSELYSALQQKVVDGQENPIATIANMKFFEVQKYLTLSDHGFIAYVFMINKPFLDKLPADQRDALVGSAKEASKYQRELIQKAEAVHLEAFKKAGVEIITLTPAQRGEFEKASRPVYDWYTGKFGTETLDLIRQNIKAN